MKSVQLNGVLVTEADIGREIEVWGFEFGNDGDVYTIRRLEGDSVQVEEGWLIYYKDCNVKWATSPKSAMPDPEPLCPRQQAANVLREAYAKCEELGMDVCRRAGGSVRISYQPEEVEY